MFSIYLSSHHLFHECRASGQVSKVALWQMISSTILWSGWNVCWMGLQRVNSRLFCGHSFRIMNKVHSGENSYARGDVAFLCVDFYRIVFSGGPSPTDVATSQLILITKFHWRDRTTNGSMFCARPKRKFLLSFTVAGRIRRLTATAIQSSSTNTAKPLSWWLVWEHSM